MNTVTLQTGLRRLTRLANYLDKADALHVKKKEPAYDQTLFATYYVKSSKSGALACHSPACALGHWGVISPDAAVLHWDDEKGLVTFEGEKARGYSYSDYAQQDFGIDGQEAFDLFSPEGCGYARTGRQAACYIRGFVARKRAEAKERAK